ncbi:uncharacterized protein BJX67DRAFT_311845 [Aspergillus lucknowensis]|uniref:Uncharacterized protein n=1 Tax=Aspergillus lucknowensis TaxID=176173 RepID=A0ABR4L9L8_9EURO
MAANRCLSADPIHIEAVPEPRAGPSESHLRRSASEDLQNLKIKRHKRISNDESSKSQTFYFVDSNSSSREKRAHVMRHHVQEKRRQQRRSHSRNSSEKKANGLPPFLSWEHKQLDTQEEAEGGPPDTERAPSRRDHTSTLRATDEPETKRLRLKPAFVSPETPPRVPTPASMLGSSRKDPFNSLPITRTADAELADYWTNKLTYWSGQNKYVKDSVFKTSMNHPLSFHAVILTYCARWKPQLYNQSNSSEINHHFSYATQGIEDAMNGHLKIDSDSLAMALAGLALQEDRFGSKEQATKYEDQAVQILRTRPRSHGLAEVFLHYVRYVMMPPTPKSPIRWHDGQEWLVTFLRAAEGLMQSHNTEKYLCSVPQRRAAFQIGSPLFALLSSGPHPSRVPLDSRIYVVRNVPTQEITRTAALIYITAALWDFQDSPGKTARFLSHLQHIVKEKELDRYPACESFIWLLLEENCDTDLKDPERGWSTGELLKIHKQLRPDLQFQYNETLLSFLMLNMPMKSVEAFEKELQPTSRIEEEG